MLLFSVLLGILIGLLRGGSLYRLGELRIKYCGLLFLAFGIKFILYTQTQSPNIGLLLEYGPFLHMLLYIPLFFVLLKNWNLFAVTLLAVGTGANGLVIFVNNGQMPVSAQGLEDSGLVSFLELLKEGAVATHSLVEEGTRLSFMGDVIIFPPFSGFSQLLSIGDILIFFGMLLLVQHVMVYGMEESE